MNKLFSKFKYHKRRKKSHSKIGYRSQDTVNNDTKDNKKLVSDKSSTFLYNIKNKAKNIISKIKTQNTGEKAYLKIKNINNDIKKNSKK